MVVGSWHLEILRRDAIATNNQQPRTGFYGGIVLATPSLNIKKREFVMLLLFSIIVASLIIRIGWLQLVNGAELQKEAIEQQTRDRIVNPKRGTIYDVNGKELAISASVDTVSIIPSQVKQAEIVARRLSEILKLDYQEVLKKAIKKGSSIQIIARKVEMAKTEEIRKWILKEKIEGIKINEDSKRCYPYNNLASYVIGFTGNDNQGLDGIELTYEKILKGLPGRVTAETDASGKDMPFGIERYINPMEGTNLVLTIDETIQHFAERYLENAIVDNKCMGGGVVIMMRPKTGEVLAMAVKPDFDLNNPFKPSNEELVAKWDTMTKQEKGSVLQRMWRNKAVSDTYEPGSTFKVVTSVAGLEEGVVKPEENFVDIGYTTVQGWKIRCWKTAGHGLETFKQAVENSCNPIFVEVSQRLGVQRFFKYVNAFGMQEKTGIALPGEAIGIAHNPDQAKLIDIAVMSIGQRFQVTPIQLITAVSAVANDGKLMKPQLVKELRDQNGNVMQEFKPQVVRQAISSETSATMRNIMEGVVAEGTGIGAYLPGYRVAGKTGTADQKSNNTYVASFVAFAPADDPVVSILVVLFDPKGASHMGGAIASPVAGHILSDVLPYMKVKPRFAPGDIVVKDVKVPSITGKTLEEAIKTLKASDLEYRVNGQRTDSASMVVDQSPKSDVVVSSKSQVILFTEKNVNISTVIVPDLNKKSVLDAARILKDLGLNIKVAGRGEVVKQEPAAGTEVTLGTEIKVEFNIVNVQD